MVTISFTGASALTGDYRVLSQYGTYLGKKLDFRFNFVDDLPAILQPLTAYRAKIFLSNLLIFEGSITLGDSGSVGYIDGNNIVIELENSSVDIENGQLKVELYSVGTGEFVKRFIADTSVTIKKPYWTGYYFDEMSSELSGLQTNYSYGEELNFEGLVVERDYRFFYATTILQAERINYSNNRNAFTFVSGGTSSLGESEVEFTVYGDSISYFIRVSDRYYIELSYTLSEPEPFIVGEDGLTVTNYINYTARLMGEVTGLIEDDITCTPSPTTITYNYAKEHDNVAIIYSYEYQEEQVQPASVTVQIDYKRPIKLTITGSDTNTYYQGRTNFFVEPEGLTLYIEYNDGTQEELTSQTITYHLTENDNNALSEGDELPIGTTYIYCYLTSVIGETTIVIKGKYELNYVADSITGVQIINNPPIVLGNKLSKFKSALNVKVTFSSFIDAEKTTHYIEENYPYFSFENDEILLEAPTEDIEINISGTTYGLDIGNFSFANPTYKDIRIINVGSTTFNNEIDTIDLTNTIAEIRYSNADYTKQFSLGTSLTQTDDTFGIQGYFSDNNPLYSSDTIDNYNGTNTLSVTIDEGSAEGYLKFTVLDPFTSSLKDTNVNITLFSIVSIKGLKIVTPAFKDYKVGDSFLNENDNTEVTIYWEQEINGRNVTMFKNIKLNSGYEGLTINPSKGTIFSNIDTNKVIRVGYAMNSSVYTEYSISVSPRSSSTTTKDIVLAGVYEQSIQLPNGKVINGDGNGVIALYEQSDTTVVNGERQLINPLAKPKMYGYIDDIFKEDITSKMVLFDDYIPPIEGSSNIEIKYPSYVEGEADKINKCTFGCLFGSNNAVNRLFVSGNSEIANADWHTAELNMTDVDGDVQSTNGDFSYIPSESIMFYGETDNKIVGYDIVSNDKLLVLKSKSDKEKTVYFRTPTSLKSINASGVEMTDLQGNVLYQEEFALVKGNNSVSGISPTTITSLNGDTLFVSSDNQIVGLDLVGIIGDNQRYANTRSLYIDKELKDLDLKNSVLWTNNKYLFLSVEGKGLYVTHYLTKTDNQYDWFFLTSKNPTSFIEIDDEIYFGNKDGSFFKLFNGTWNDITKLFAYQTLLVGIKYAQEEEKVYVENGIIQKMEDDVDYKFQVIPNEDYRKNIYYQIAKVRTTADGNTDLIIDATDNVLKLVAYKNGITNRAREEELIKMLGDKNIFYLNYLEEDIPTLGSRIMDCVRQSEFDGFGYQVKVEGEQYINPLTETSTMVYKLFKKTENGWERMDVSNLYNAGICKLMSENLDIFNVDKENSTFQLKENGKLLDIVNYGNQDTTTRFARAEIKKFDEVQAYFITAPMLATSLNNFKTVWQVTVTNDTGIPSALEVSIASNKIPYAKTKTIATSDQLGVDFNELTFYKVDLDKVVVPRTYTVARTLPMQKFLCFGFRNKKGNNAVLSEMAITYTVPYSSYGSD